MSTVTLGSSPIATCTLASAMWLELEPPHHWVDLRYPPNIDVYPKRHQLKLATLVPLNDTKCRRLIPLPKICPPESYPQNRRAPVGLVKQAMLEAMRLAAWFG